MSSTGGRGSETERRIEDSWSVLQGLFAAVGGRATGLLRTVPPRPILQAKAQHILSILLILSPFIQFLAISEAGRYNSNPNSRRTLLCRRFRGVSP